MSLRDGVGVNVQAIETHYDGYRFRSRLEARWAVFFKWLGIGFEYEFEGYEMPGGDRYLPDFFLPAFDRHPGLYVEVKPIGGDFSKARRFSEASGFCILLAEGTPDLRTYTLIEPADPGGYLEIDCCFKFKYLPGGRHGGEYRLFYAAVEHDLDYSGGVIGDAVNAARAARFERAA